MSEVEYVYTKPEEPPKKSHGKLIEILVLLVILVIATYFIIYEVNNSSNQNSASNKTFTIGDETFTIISIPSKYKGSEGLDYIRNNSASELARAKSACIDKFKGGWLDTLDAMGCYNMQDFSMDYCSEDIIQTLVNRCNQINGNPDCSTYQVTCTV